MIFSVGRSKRPIGFFARIFGIALLCGISFGAENRPEPQKGAKSAKIVDNDRPAPPTVKVKNLNNANEAERLIAAVLKIAPERRLPFVSGYFLGRKYRIETKKRIKEQRAQPKAKKEADNAQPIPLPLLITSMEHLDCMTYVEHVLAFSSADRSDYVGKFLPRLVDIMFDAGGKPLMNHLRNHFTSQWAETNERKGYIKDLARNHPEAVTRSVVLNKVGNNRTFYVEDRFMIASAPRIVHYFPIIAVLSGKAPLASGDVLAMVCDKEGLDVTHMGFYIEQGGKKFLRHASFALNRIVDQDFEAYLRGKKELKGLMVFRPRLAAAPPFPYNFVPIEQK